jgi:hypothetical protein
MLHFLKGKLIYNNGKCNIKKFQGGRDNPTHNKRRKVIWVDYILRRNCLLNRIVEGTKEEDIEGMGRPGRRCRQLLNNLKKTRRHWKLKEKALCVISLHRTPQRTRFGRSNGPVGRQIV